MATRGWTSSAASMALHVFRAPCTVILGTPARVMRRSKLRVKLPGSIGVPCMVVNTRPVSVQALAALTAQFGTEDWLRVLALGVFLHGAAGDILSREEDPSGVLAHQVADTIPDAREWLLKEIQFGG